MVKTELPCNLGKRVVVINVGAANPVVACRPGPELRLQRESRDRGPQSTFVFDPARASHGKGCNPKTDNSRPDPKVDPKVLAIPSLDTPNVS
jgi:hypothetical protein